MVTASTTTEEGLFNANGYRSRTLFFKLSFNRLNRRNYVLFIWVARCSLTSFVALNVLGEVKVGMRCRMGEFVCFVLLKWSIKRSQTAISTLNCRFYFYLIPPIYKNEGNHQSTCFALIKFARCGRLMTKKKKFSA